MYVPQINSLLGRFDKKRKRRKLNTALTAESAEFLLNKPSAIQSESKKLGEEIQALLNHKSAREKTIIENLKSNKTAQVRLYAHAVRPCQDYILLYSLESNYMLCCSIPGKQTLKL